MGHFIFCKNFNFEQKLIKQLSSIFHYRNPTSAIHILGHPVQMWQVLVHHMIRKQAITTSIRIDNSCGKMLHW